MSPDLQYEATRQAYIAHEVTTWTYEQQFRLQCDISPTKSAYVKWQDHGLEEYRSLIRGYYESVMRTLTDRKLRGEFNVGFKEPNVEKIEEDVRALYSGVYGTPPSIDREEEDVRPAGPKIDTGEWKCPGQESP